MSVVLCHIGSKKASVAFARARMVNPTIATLLVPYLSPSRPPTICPNNPPNTTIPPTIPLYFAWDQPASLMKISITIGPTKMYNSERAQRNIKIKAERTEKALIK